MWNPLINEGWKICQRDMQRYVKTHGQCTDKKENQIFLIYKELLSGAVAKSYMGKGFLIYEKKSKYFPIYEEAFSHIWLCNSEFPYIRGKFDFLFYQCVNNGSSLRRRERVLKWKTIKEPQLYLLHNTHTSVFICVHRPVHHSIASHFFVSIIMYSI